MVVSALIVPVLLSVMTRAQATASFKSNEVHPDGSITFRYQDPAAGTVLLNLESESNLLPMDKDSGGVWSRPRCPRRFTDTYLRWTGDRRSTQRILGSYRTWSLSETW